MKKVSILKLNLMRATLMLALIVTCAAAWAQTTQNVSYIDANGITKTVTATVLTGTETEIGTTFENTWYVVNSDISYTSGFNYHGFVHLILADDKTMTVNNGSGNAFFGNNRNDYLYIYGQTNGTGTLNASCNYSDRNAAAIRSGLFNIYGGKVNATASGCGYAIYVDNNNIRISGGQVTATSGAGSTAAILANDVSISGGKVTATANGGYSSVGIQASHAVNISGGQVKANGSQYGIRAYTSVTLNWSNTTDTIYSNSYYNSNISIAGGKYFKDANSGNVYCGNVGTSINGKTLIPATQAEYINYVFTQNVSGSGTSQSPYIISTTAGWNAFCDKIEIGETFSGKYLKLGANIEVSRMAGIYSTTDNNNRHAFSGAFNGQNNTLTFNCTAANDYVAPFAYISGTSAAHASISDLNVVTNITATDHRHIAGLVALHKGNVDVTNCHAVVNLNATVGDTNPSDLYPAGLVSQTDSSGRLTISNCTTTGTIATDGKYAAGLVGVVQGTDTIEDCVSSVTINSSTAGDGTHGGLVAVTQTNSTTTIEGCLFNGKLLTKYTTDTLATGNCGGILGWKNANVTIKNTLYAPAALIGDEHEVVAGTGTGSNLSGTFYRGNVPTLTNCYYTRTLHNAQGKQAHSITAGENVTVANAGTLVKVYNTSGITIYGTGIKYNDVLYASNGDAVSLTLGNTGTAPLGYNFDDFTVNAGTLENNVLTMPDENVTVTANIALIDWAIESDGSAEHPYMIYNKDQLNLLAYRVNGTHGEPRQPNGYSGKYFKLGADITYSHEGLDDTESNYEAIGGYYDHSLRYFRGHFDGDGHTVSGIRIYKGGTDNYTDCYQGLFSAINSTANIHDVTLADTYITGYYYIGGIAGESRYSNITRCHVTSTVTIKAHNDNSSYHGGIVGAASAGSNVTYCTSAATLTFTSNSRYYGAITGYVLDGTLSDNLVISATVPATYLNHHGAICGYNSSSTLARNYYYNCTVAGVQNATGKGCDNTDITANDGAVPGNVRVVEGYGEEQDRSKWAFIASPVATEEGIAPTAVDGLIPVEEGLPDTTSTEYDLYRFNQSAEAEWENYHAHYNSDFTTLVNGQGYLYANKNDVTLTFTGTTYNTGVEPVEVPLTYVSGKEFAGWNLVGNPFPRAAYANRSYYVVGQDGTIVEPSVSNAYISPCTGVMVHTDHTNDTIIFSTTPQTQSQSKGMLQVAVSQTVAERAEVPEPVEGPRGGVSTSSTTLDKAIVSFNEGDELAKFVFNIDNAKIYIPQGAEEYAIACSDSQGEMPVNFKAYENGTYTIAVSPENVEMVYLHLIDNMTGADVDLLAATSTGSVASYTFTARTTDYESRFKLVFVCGDANDDNDGDNETFAFYFNGNWIIANDGDATLQVIDINGRILSSESIHGSVSKSIHAAAGVYMLRLINGDEVRTQKIVVR